MSDIVNQELYERAAQMIDYFEGKLPAELIERALNADDLDELAYQVSQAEAEASQQEMYGADCV